MMVTYNCSCCSQAERNPQQAPNDNTFGPQSKVSPSVLARLSLFLSEVRPLPRMVKQNLSWCLQAETKSQEVFDDGNTSLVPRVPPI